MKKRLISILMALCMVLTLLPATAFAADVVDSGTCGTNATWTLDSDGLLTIGGTGEMTSYYYETYVPWQSYSNSVKNVAIGDGITSIGGYAFSGCTALERVTVPDSVTSIGESAFSGCTALKNLMIPASVTSVSRFAFRYCSNLTVCCELNSPAVVSAINDSANVQVISDSRSDDECLLDRSQSSYFADTEGASINGCIPVTVEYSVAEEKWNTLSNTNITIRIPDNTELADGTLKVNGVLCTDYATNGQIISVPVTENAGVVKLSAEAVGQTDLISYALLSYGNSD